MVGIHVHLNGARYSLAVSCRCRQQIGAVSGVEGVLVATCRLSDVNTFACLLIDKRLDKFAFGIHRHLYLGGVDVAHAEQHQCHNTK